MFAMSKKDGFDPIKRSEKIEKIVCAGDRRKYYRFRPARFYGGIATADCVGCSLQCIFCWSWDEVVDPAQYGRFYSPQEVARKVTNIIHKKGYRKVRISGNEPTIAREHLLKLMELIPSDVLFILETNGIMIGHDETYADDLARYSNLYVRIGLKGCNEDEFSAITGAHPVGFSLQLEALKNLYEAGVKVYPAAMVSFSSPDSIKALKRKLRKIDKKFEDFEIEELALYKGVEERLKGSGIEYGIAYEP